MNKLNTTHHPVVNNFGKFLVIINPRPRGVGVGVLQISSDGDDRNICKGFEIFNSGIFLGGKIWQVFYLGGLFCCCCCCFWCFLF